MKQNKNSGGNKPLHLTDATFDKAIESNPVALIDFWAEWCGPCIALGPAIEKLAAAYHNKALVGKLDAEKNQSTAKRFKVSDIPTVIIFKNGKEVKRAVGYGDGVERLIENALKKQIQTLERGNKA